MSSEVLTDTILGKMSDVRKWRRQFLVHILTMFLALRGRINFSSLTRYGCLTNLCYRTNFKRPFNWLEFNTILVMEHTSPDRMLVFDPTFLRKSGKQTPGVGYFYSGSAGKAKWGLEAGGLAVVDVQAHTALHLQATRTPADLADSGETLLEGYARCITDQAEALRAISSLVCVDAFFARYPFIEPLCHAGFHVVTRLRDDAVLRYPYLGPASNGVGRPPTYAARVDVCHLDEQYFTPCAQDEAHRWIAYEARLHVKALKRWCKIVIVHEYDATGKLKTPKIFCSTEPTMPGADVLLYYQGRYQIEFLFRDAKQFTGLEHCQSLQGEALDFHLNAALTAVSVAKVAHWFSKPVDERGPFSMADIKTLYFNELLLNRFFVAYGLNPHLAKNNPAYHTLCNLGKIAA